MALFDVLRSRKREEMKPKRLPKGAFSPKARLDSAERANRPLAEKQLEKPAKKQGRIEVAQSGKAEKPKKGKIKEEKPKEELKPKTSQSLLAAEFLLKPHITEQSNILAQKNIYTFRVSPRAHKIIIKKAIKEMYGFKPIKIRIINVPPKKRMVRGKTGIKSGLKKALVYLKEGDKIEFI